MIEKLIEKYRHFEQGMGIGLTFEEVQFLCDNEEHEVFMFDFSLYRDLMDYRDHLQEED